MLEINTSKIVDFKDCTCDCHTFSGEFQLHMDACCTRPYVQRQVYTEIKVNGLHAKMIAEYVNKLIPDEYVFDFGTTDILLVKVLNQ